MDANGHETVADLVRFLEIEQSTVSRWLDGGVPSIEKIRKVASRVGMTEFELLTAAGLVPGEPARPETRRMASALTAVQEFLDDPRSTKDQKQFVLQGVRQLLNMSIEARDGIHAEPRLRRR
jgi:transcriptional regulator with XRE-family HTH domain